jgi:hypothetical protein
VIAAFEREHQALAAAGVADDFEAIFNRLRAADVEVDAALHAELLLDVAGDGGGQLDLALMQILRGDLRHGVDGLVGHRVQARVLVAEIGHRVPHLQVQVRRALPVVHVGAVAVGEDRRVIHIVHRVAVGTDLGLQRAQAILLLAGGDHAGAGRGGGREFRSGFKRSQGRRPFVPDGRRVGVEDCGRFDAAIGLNPRAGYIDGKSGEV